MLILGLSMSIAAFGAAKSPGAPPVAAVPACTPDLPGKWAEDLQAFLAKPTAEGAKLWTARLCQTAPDGPHPCPVTVSEDRADELAAAAEKSPLVVPVIACALPSAEAPATAQELNVLQSRLLSLYKAKFFAQWGMIPKSLKIVAQKFDDFASLTPEAQDDFPGRVKILKERIEILAAAPPKLRAEIRPVLDTIREEVSAAEKAGKSDGEINFKTSNFRKQMAEKTKSMVPFDPVRATTFANEILLNEGLNFKVYLKTSNFTWNVCSASTGVGDACQSTTVGFPRGHDSCGANGLLGLLFQADRPGGNGRSWFVMSGSSSYRIDIGDLFTPVAVKLAKNGSVMREWDLPNGFVPEAVSADLRSLYSSVTLYNDAGKKLGLLHLIMHDNGRFQFMDISKEKATLLTRAPVQDIKAFDGSIVEMQLPRVCP